MSRTTTHPARRAAASVLAIAGALSACATSANECQDAGVELIVLGSGGPEYDDGLTSTGYVVAIDGRARVLVDAGPGTSLQFGKQELMYEDLHAILLTHLHVDHSGDLPAFVKGSFFKDRDRDLPVYGPAGNELMPSTTKYLDTLFGTDGAYRYLNDFLEGSESSSYLLEPFDVPLEQGKVHRFDIESGITASATFVHHGPVAAVAWRIDIDDCSIAFSGDMSNRYDTFATLANEADVAVMHNAVPEDADRVARNLHMTPSEIGRIAAKSGVKSVLLSHRMKRTIGNEAETLQQIRSEYPGPAEFVRDGDRVDP